MARTIVFLGAAVALLIAAWFVIDGVGDSTPRSAPVMNSNASESKVEPPSLVDGTAREELDGEHGRAEVRSGDRTEPTPVGDAEAAAVRVRVLTWRGTPAVGVPVGLLLVAEQDIRPRVTRETDAEGLVAFVQSELADGRDGLNSAIIHVNASLHPLPQAELLLSELPQDPIELRLPPYGAVRVRFDAMGSGLAATRVSLSIRDVLRDRLSRWNRTSANLRDGEAVFPMVDLDRKLSARVAVSGVNIWPGEEFDGPRVDGQEVLVEVPLIKSGTLAGFRLIDEKANVLGSRNVEFTFESGSEENSSRIGGVVGSNAEGFIFLQLRAEDRPPDQRTLRARISEEAIEGSYEFPRSLRQGVVMLGDLQLAGAPILVEGRVIDEDGAGIEGVRVSSPVHDVHDISKANGAFALRGSLDESVLDIAAQMPGFIPAGAPRTPVGARGLQIRLMRGARIEGRIRTAISDLDAHLAIVLREQTETGSRRQHVRLGAFSLDGLKPGNYDISIHLSGYAEALQRWPGSRLVAGETLTLPDVDLDALARIVKLRLLDPQGGNVKNARVLVNLRVDDGGFPTYEGVLATGGVATLVLAPSPVELMVLADGFPPLSIVPTREEEVVTLETGPRLVVTPSHRLDLPEGTRIELQANRLELELPRGEYSFRSGGGTSSSRGSSPVPKSAVGKLDAHGAGEFTLSGFGRHQLRAELITASDAGNRRIPLEGVIDSEFVAVRGVAVVHLALNLDAAKLAEILGRDR
ncbi:MAG: hypothetical protein AB7I19_09635 [Planctomycetota bacterium]